MKTSIIAIVGLAAAVMAATVLIPTARITVHAIDEAGNDLSGVDASITFDKLTSSTGSWGSSNQFTKSGKTDAQGKFTAEAPAGSIIYYGAGGGAYYRSTGRYEFNAQKEYRYEPWNPEVDLVVKKIVNPIPMYVRRAQIEVPEAAEDASVGFDLEVGDWVTPHGKGTTSDFLVSLKRQFADRRNYEAGITITFPNKGDGLQPIGPEDVNSGSELKLPRAAPEEDYEPKLTASIGATEGRPGHEDAQANRSYFIRTRTVLDDDGKVKSARYGKIDGDIRLDAINSKTCLVLFTYYFNPTASDRNMEFNPTKNLSANLAPDERVTAP